MEVQWIDQVVESTNAALTSLLQDKAAQAKQLSPAAVELVEAVSDLTLRGGKRLRPAALHAGYRCANAQGGPAETTTAGCAIELLQTYLLIQDDWMDQDPERRGGPSVHKRLHTGERSAHLSASFAILAADMACVFAYEMLGRTEFPAARQAEGRAAFDAMHFEVLCGQQLDLLGDPDVARMHELKTGSDTVRGPLRLGAILGDASAAQLQALEDFGAPLGKAFQLRDDLLGTFGDHGATGKPTGNDLRAGKHTALVAVARTLLKGPELDLLQRVHGDSQASAQDIGTLTALLAQCGAKAQVEQRLSDLLGEAEAGLKDSALEEAGAAMLRELASRVALRDR